MSETAVTLEAKPARPQWQFRRPKPTQLDLRSSLITEKDGRRKCWDGKGKTYPGQGFTIPSHL